MRLTEPAFDDLRVLMRLDPQIVRWALKKMLVLERDPEAGEPLHGALAGWRKLVVGDRDWRIVWRVSHDAGGSITVDVAEVWAIGARSDGAVYAEMASRVSSLPASPATVALSEIVTRLGKLGERLAVRAEPGAQPELPEWLVERLTRQAGLQADEVSRMSLEEAVDAWASWMSRSRD
ncbi:MAG: type II toxin-antitoxin system RelE family toxin [Mycobacteriales bacterium]